MPTVRAIRMQKSDTDLDRHSWPEMRCQTAERKRRGRLKIFSGAAPGVGTTREMVRGGIAKRREGVDVVVGAVETHGRKEVETLLKELELVPGRGAAFGRAECEMDLDAILALLVDELAHVNAPGARHPRRFMNVRELLRAGIDVYTTLAMQQVESLNNTGTKMPRFPKGAIVPDSLINRADEIEVVDVAPGDILQNLRRGKLSSWFAAS